MQLYSVPLGQFRLEQYFERKFLYPFDAALVIIAVIAGVRRDWITLGICLLACFLNGLIATKLPKNRTKSFSQLARGSAGVGEPADDASLPVNLNPTQNALAKCSYVAVATAAIITYHLDQSRWVILAAMAVAYIAVMLFGTVTIARSGVE